MTAQEFSHEFDVLYNNITNGVAPGVNEYEKSVFLTRALLEFIQDIIIGNTSTGDSVDSSTLVKSLLYPLYKHEEIPDTGTFPDDVLYDLNMILKLGSSYSGYEVQHVPIIPISYDDVYKIMNNPFYKNKHRAFILLTEDSSKRNIYYDGDLQYSGNTKVIYDYIRKPNPIITESLSPGFTIDGYSSQCDSELPDATHFEILKRAVLLALVANGVVQS